MTPIERAAYLAHAESGAFRRRMDQSILAIESAARLGEMVIMSSWGKDSVVMADLILRTLGRVPILHIASSYRLPGWEPIQEHFEARTTVHVIEPRRSLEETIAWLHEVGLPHERTPAQQRAIVKSIKKDVGAAWCKEHGYAVQALGLRADESAQRRAFLRRAGTLYQAREVYIVAPLAWWTARDVWAYLVSRALPWHQMYDKETHGITRETQRNTGWLSTDGAEHGRIAWLRHHYPEQYRMLVEHFPRCSALT